jgi:hypothetical protein
VAAPPPVFTQTRWLPPPLAMRIQDSKVPLLPRWLDADTWRADYGRAVMVDGICDADLPQWHDGGSPTPRNVQP